SHPPLPIAFAANRGEPVVVLPLMLLEVTGYIEERLGYQPPLLQQDGDEQTSYAAIAVQERVDGLELGVYQGNTHQGRQRRRRMVDISFQLTQGRLLCCTTHAVHQDPVAFGKQSRGHRQA